MSEPRPPADQPARDRIKRDVDATMFVEAGAGTGKTRELVQRIVTIVLAGHEIGRVAAITFTRAAAAELRDRVRHELEQAAMGKSHYDGLPAESMELCRRAVEAIDGAAIQTLHSFAEHLLALYPLEAGLPPRTELTTGIQAAVQFEDRWRQFLGQLTDAPRPDVAEALPRAFVLGLTPAHLRAIAWRFHIEWDRLEGATFEERAVWPGGVAAVLSAIDVATECKAYYTGKPGADLLLHVLESTGAFGAELRAGYEEIVAAEAGGTRLAAEDRLLRRLSAPKKLGSGGKGKSSNWGGHKADVAGALDDAERARAAFVADVRTMALVPLLRAIQGFVLAYRDERVREGQLEFHDLLVLARNLLRDNDAVRRAVAGRFDYLLIDEFQDTDPLQVEIAELIAGDRESPVVGGLFFVGDPKQSIYRFRRADIDVYRSVRDRYGSAPAGEVVQLTQNFRSVGGIISWVDEVFARLFLMERGAAGEAPPRQVDFQPLQAARELPPGAGPAVTIFGRATSEQSDLANDVRRREARDIAAAVERICGVGGEPWRVWDAAGETWQPARYSDITILLPTRAALGEIEQALEGAAIPIRVEARSLLFQTQEVRELMAILGAIDDPTDDVAVVAALRSQGFACGDDDLLRFSRLRRGWDYRWAAEESTDGEGDASPGGEPVAEAMKALARFHAARQTTSVSALVEEVIRERKLLELAFAQRRPREVWARFRIVQEQARVYCEAGGATLRGFLRWMRQQAAEQARVAESVAPDEDDDAVGITTIHAAKGLEFPIVVMAGLAAEKPGDAPVVLWDADHRPAVRVGSERSEFMAGPYAKMRDRERALDQLEADRLMYVAATRARDHLVVSLWRKQTSGEHASRHRASKCSPAECLAAICEETAGTWEQLPFSAEAAVRRRPPTRGVLETAADRQQWKEARDDLLQRERLRTTFAATAIAHLGQAGSPPGDKAEPDDDSAPWRRGRSGTAVGRAVHAVLQTIDMATGAGIDEAARAQAAAEGIDGRHEEIARRVRAAIGSGTVLAALGSARYWREVYVAAEVEGATIEGFIDLLYESPDGLVVVDYKTDAADSAAELDAARERYRLQGAAYALALQVALRREVAECVFLFVDEHRAQARAIDDLATSMETVRALIRGALTPVSPPARDA